MENFINDMKTLNDFKRKAHYDSLAIQLIEFEKELDLRKPIIEESILSGEYYQAKMHVATLGVMLGKIHENIEEMELKEKEDCNCIQNISKEEFNQYLKSIGGLESGYGSKYWGKSKIRRFFFNVTDWIICRLPYFKESQKFSSKGPVRLFFQNISYWIMKPILKDQKPKNPFRSMIDTAGSFSVGPGWYGLIKSLIEKSIAAGWNKEVCQVKEKFGGLRFYINGASTEVHDIISQHEKLSYEICEQCGEPGEVRGGGWIQTLCDKHYNKI